jgi:hypothetical protein
MTLVREARHPNFRADIGFATSQGSDWLDEYVDAYIEWCEDLIYKESD